MSDPEQNSVPPSSVGGANFISIDTENITDSISKMGYYDIMLIGRSGQGKTTTSEKLLIANPTRVDYQKIDEISRTPEGTLSPEVDPSTREMKMHDLSMWLIPSDQYSLERISTRMKNMAFYRILSDPHLEVNNAHQADMHCIERRTLQCELFSNETTKIRILDVPGFFGAIPTDEATDTNTMRDTTHSTHLEVMRTILHIQTAMKMKFRRILYFLPCRGTLEVVTAALQQELSLLVYYFGKSIFQTIILVATFDSETYKIMPPDLTVEMTPEGLDKSKQNFKEALGTLLPEDTPDPPVIFVSLRESCESILRKVKETEVAQESLELALSPLVCAKCNVTIGESKGVRVAALKGAEKATDWRHSVPYDHSRCHPEFKPYFTTGQKIASGIAYTIRAIVHREWEWPDLNRELCTHCFQRPGTEGCIKIGNQHEGVAVDHSSKVEGSHRGLIQTPESSLTSQSSRGGESLERSDSRSVEGSGGIEIREQPPTQTMNEAVDYSEDDHESLPVVDDTSIEGGFSLVVPVEIEPNTDI